MNLKTLDFSFKCLTTAPGTACDFQDARPHVLNKFIVLHSSGVDGFALSFLIWVGGLTPGGVGVPLLCGWNGESRARAAPEYRAWRKSDFQIDALNYSVPDCRSKIYIYEVDQPLAHCSEFIFTSNFIM